MVDSARWRHGRRHLAGGSISLLGLALVSIPIFDIWEDVARFSWQLTLTFLENAMFLVLSLFLVGGGVWLFRSDWETDLVVTVARRTLLATGAIVLLIGWAMGTQYVAMGQLKPHILALDGVLVAATTAFGLSVSSVRSNRLQRAVTRERATNERLTQLYEVARDLETATAHEEAYDVVEAAVRDLVRGSPFRLVVDDESVLAHDWPDTVPESDRQVIDVGARGRLELLGRVDANAVATAELFGTYLDETIQRIEREARIRKERDVLEFVNRTLRHDITGDLSLVQARLRMLDRDDAVQGEANRDHLGVALNRVDEMDDFVNTMRTYMRSVLDDEHALEAVALAPTVEDHVTSVREVHPEAEIVYEGVPEVAVAADDLLDRVFVNLLNNALEHNHSQTPHIVVGGERGDGVVRIRVADDGPGISEHRRRSIFERGERGTESDGTGFGLYLVKDVVERYGGDISVRDNDPHGTVFVVELPVADEAL